MTPTARNRFIYYPDHLVLMPSGGESISNVLASLVSEPIFKGIALAPITEIFRPGRNESLVDESISSFMNRRFGSPNLTNNIMSAVMHGVYAGDIDKLSARSLMRRLWDAEQDHQSLIRGFVRSVFGHPVRRDKKDLALERIMTERMSTPFDFMRKNARAYNFKSGMSTLTEALASYLKSHPNVEIKMSEEISGVEYDAESAKIQVHPQSHVFTMAEWYSAQNSGQPSTSPI
jgi:oxygen-dependent protoporphyrinogen oxidase